MYYTNYFFLKNSYFLNELTRVFKAIYGISCFTLFIIYIELASLEVMKEIWLCHANFSSSRSPRNFICSESVGVPVRLIVVLFSTNAFSGILGIFGEELNTEYFVLDTFVTFGVVGRAH